MIRQNGRFVFAGILLGSMLGSQTRSSAATLPVNDGSATDWAHHPIELGQSVFTFMSATNLNIAASVESNAIAVYPPVLPLIFHQLADPAEPEFELTYRVETAPRLVIDTTRLEVRSLPIPGRFEISKRFYSAIDQNGQFTDELGVQTSIDGSTPPPIQFEQRIGILYVKLTGQLQSLEPGRRTAELMVAADLEEVQIIDVYNTRLATPEPGTLFLASLGSALLVVLTLARRREHPGRSSLGVQPRQG